MVPPSVLTDPPSPPLPGSACAQLSTVDGLSNGWFLSAARLTADSSQDHLSTLDRRAHTAHSSRMLLPGLDGCQHRQAGGHALDLDDAPGAPVWHSHGLAPGLADHGGSRGLFPGCHRPAPRCDLPHRRDLVDHEPARGVQAVGGARLDFGAEQRRVSRIGRERADDDRVGAEPR